MLLIFVHVPFQITQQLEGICLQVIGLVLQKPIIGMAGVCAQAVYCFVYTRTLSHTHTLTAFVIHYLYTDHYSNSTALCFLLSIQRFILPHNCTTNSGISVRKMRKMFLFRFIWFNQYRFFLLVYNAHHDLMKKNIAVGRIYLFFLLFFNLLFWNKPAMSVLALSGLCSSILVCLKYNPVLILHLKSFIPS